MEITKNADGVLSTYERMVKEAEDTILAEAWATMIDAGEPLGALVLVEVQPKIVESISAGGLVMPGGLPLRVAVVISVGPGYWDGRNMCYVPLGLAVGDRVVMRGSAGIPVDPIRDLRLLPPGDTLFRIPAEKDHSVLPVTVPRGWGLLDYLARLFRTPAEREVPADFPVGDPFNEGRIPKDG